MNKNFESWSSGETMVGGYFKSLYARTMCEAYRFAEAKISLSLGDSRICLDCGSGAGHMFDRLLTHIPGFISDYYFGIERNQDEVRKGRSRGLEIINGDLDEQLHFADNHFDSVFALSVLEHLLYGCHFLRETRRVLKPAGTLILLTPNISTYFTIARLLAGKMPSTGPHPDSNELLRQEDTFSVSETPNLRDVESDTPSHRHMVVFSYRALSRYLEMLGFSEIQGRGFGVYPFPNFLQPVLERVDPWHCHQMVFIARK